MPRQKASLTPGTRIRTTVAGAVSGVLCVALAAPLDLVAAQQKIASASTMDVHQQALHALNRLTFGPRPGDVAMVNRMGLDAWFEQQLHPERIPDAGLDARLSSFPAMRLTQAELIRRFPSPGMLRRYSDGGLQAPADPLERVIYADAAFTYEEKQEAKKQHKGIAVGGPLAMAGGIPGVSTEALAASGSQKMADFATASPSSADQASAQAILALAPAERMPMLLAMTPETMQALRAALKGNGEQRLMQGLAPAEKEEVAAMQAPLRVVGVEANATRLLRDVYSDRQVQAVMTDFWLNHFNVYDRKNQEEPYLLPAYEREAILPHALGRFEDLLVATAQSPAMLMYLDNWTSVGPNSKAAQRVGRPRPPVAETAHLAGAPDGAKPTPPAKRAA